MKKAQDFLVDSALGEKSYTVSAPDVVNQQEIKLSIEDNAVPLALLGQKKTMRAAAAASILKKMSESLSSFGSPNSRDKATFFRLLAIMLNAGVPLIKSLDTIAEQTVNHSLKKTIFDVARTIEKGNTLSDSMEPYKDIFAQEHLGMIRSGEASGQLNRILLQLAVQVEKTATLIRKVRGALAYPAFIIFVMVAVISALMVLVVPKIAELFIEAKAQLPFITRVVIGASLFMRDKWPFIFAFVVALIVGFIGARRTNQGRYATDWCVTHLPIVGTLVRKSLLARFTRSLGNLLGSGVPIVQSLIIDAKGLGNEPYRRRVMLASEDVAHGIPLAESLRDTPEFPGMMVQMISVGEQTAQLDSIALKVADFYEEEVDAAVSGLSSVIEPLLLVVVGMVVSAIIAAVMLPLIQITQLTGAL